jgi:hypothetical protein
MVVMAHGPLGVCRPVFVAVQCIGRSSVWIARTKTRPLAAPKTLDPFFLIASRLSRLHDSASVKGTRGRRQ